MTTKRKIVIFMFLIIFAAFCNGYSPDSIFQIIEDYANGKYIEILQRDIPQFENNDDFVVYNLICINSSLMAQKEIPKNILDNIDKIEKPLKDYLLLEAAKFYFNSGNYKEAENFIDKVNFSQLKNKQLLYDSLRLKAHIFSKQSLWEKEASVWSAIQKIEGIKLSKKQEAAFREAVAFQNKGDYEKAKILFEKSAFDSQINPFGSRALKELFEKYPEKTKSISNEKKIEFSRQFIKNGRGRDAVFLLSEIDETKRDVSLWANALYRSRMNEELFNFCDKILASQKKVSSKEVEAVLKGLWATLRTDEKEKALKYYDFILKNSSLDSLAFNEANYALGSFLFCQGKFKETVPYFQKTSLNQDSKFYYNALFKEVLARHLSNEKEDTLAEKLILKENPFRERVSFFWANYLKSERSFEMAEKSYYSAMKDGDFYKKVDYFLKSHKERIFTGKTDKNSFPFKLYKSNFILYALNEMEKSGKEISKEDRYTYRAILAESGNYCKEFSDIDENLVFSHPAPFFKEISDAAEKNGVEKSLMLAICRNESRFDPYAFSNTGAVGLFQIMPETAKALLGREVSEEELLEPKFNAEVAALYLKKLKEMFSSESMVIASYNAGEDVVSRWKDNFPKDDTLFILMIPYFETQNYTESVLFDKMIYDRFVVK